MNRRLQLIPAIVLILIGCATTLKTVPLKGNYEEKPYELIVEKNKDVIWDNLVDFFATGGFSIKIIDKSSGLIVSDKTKLTWTYENSKGGLEHPQSWVVLPKRFDPASKKPLVFNNVFGEWNVRIKEIDNNKTRINVNLVNIAYSATQYGFMSSTGSIINWTDGKSTGEFEKLIAAKIK